MIFRPYGIPCLKATPSFAASRASGTTAIEICSTFLSSRVSGWSLMEMLKTSASISTYRVKFLVEESRHAEEITVMRRKQTGRVPWKC